MGLAVTVTGGMPRLDVAHGRKRSLLALAIALVFANVATMIVAVACVSIAKRAWEARDQAAAAARAQASTQTGSYGRGAGTEAFVPRNRRAPRWRDTTMDRMVLFGFLGTLSTVFCTWRLVVGSTAVARERPRSRRRP